MFQAWCELTFPRSWKAAGIDSMNRSWPDRAAYVVREVCEVTSRAEIDCLPEAFERFNNLIREPWHLYCEERKTS